MPSMFTGVAGAAFVSADASAAPAAVTDAPATGQKLVTNGVVVSVGSALTVSLTEETSGTLLLRLYMAANTTQMIRMGGLVKLATANKRMMVQTSAAGNVSVLASYYSEA